MAEDSIKLEFGHRSPPSLLLSVAISEFQQARFDATL